VVEIDRSREEDWFRQNEQQLIETAREARLKRERERAAREKEEERRRLKELHFMKCPKCGHDLKEENLQGVTLDRCTFCEGLYLDAGELEALFLRKADERRSLFPQFIHNRPGALNQILEDSVMFEPVRILISIASYT